MPWYLRAIFDHPAVTRVVVLVFCSAVAVVTIARCSNPDGLTRNWDLGFPEYAGILTICVWGIAIATWGMIRQLTPKGQLEALAPEMEELLGRLDQSIMGVMSSSTKGRAAGLATRLRKLKISAPPLDYGQWVSWLPMVLGDAKAHDIENARRRFQQVKERKFEATGEIDVDEYI